MGIDIQKSKELEERTLAFAVEVITVFSAYSKNDVTKPIVSQVIRSVSSIGANYREANNASSLADFKNKIFIAKKEAAETEYWIEILSKLTGREFSSLQSEAHQLLMIFQKIISSLKAKNEK